MKKLLNLFKKSWLVSLIGIILLSIVILYVSPMIFGDNATMVSIASIVGMVIVWLVFQLVTLLRVRKKNEAILNSLQNDVVERDLQQEAIDDELDILKERLSGAVNELKSNRFANEDGGSQYLYQLPWYILIGPPASGKTTLLKNSSLKTALSEKYGRDSIAGVGGTRHCDWWFTEEAVLLDTAGRYTTQDSNETDHKAWLGFLEMLQKSRERRPLNGIIIAISMDELLKSDSIHEHASEIRKRLQELYEQFNLKLPVYLIFTKSDLLSGFSEYFEGMDQQSREQVWGVTFTIDNKVVKNPLAILSEELNLLEENLKDKTILKLEKEVDLERRKKIYAFPEQFAIIKSSVNQFANEVFAPSRYQHNIFFRGVYFTSAEQTGNPIDKLLSNLANTFGFEQRPFSSSQQRGKSYFIDNLLQKVIFPESELAGLNPSYEKKKRLMQWGVLSGAVFSVLAGSGLWFASYAKNNTTINQLMEKTELLEKATNNNKDLSDLKGVLDILDAASILFDSDESFMATMGLSQQEDLKDKAKISYRNALEAKLLPHVVFVLETKLQKLNVKLKSKTSEELGKNNDNLDLFETLKSYLILRPFQDKHFLDNKNILHTLVLNSWEKDKRYDLSPENYQSLSNHLRVLLNEKPSLSMNKLPQNATLVADARNILGKVNTSKIVYAQLKTTVAKSKNLPEFVLDGVRGKVTNADSYFERTSGKSLTEGDGILGVFTYQGSLQVRAKSLPAVEEYLKDDWVLNDIIINTDGSDKKSSSVDNAFHYKRVSGDVLRLYQREYIAVWDEFLNDVKLTLPKDIDEAKNLLDSLLQDSSPIKQFVTSVADETYLSKPTKGAEAAAQEAQNEIAKKLGKAGMLANKVLGDKAISNLTKLKNDLVSPHYKNIRELGKKSSSSYKRITKSLRKLYRDLDKLENTEGSERLKIVRSIEKELDKLKTSVNRRPTKPITAWILSLRKAIINIINESETSVTNKSWKDGVYVKYATKIKGRYPIGGGISRAIPRGDFSDFFGPDGIVESYFNENLKGAVNKTGTVWATKSGEISKVSDSALIQLQRADKIRQAFFPNNSASPSIKLFVKPSVSDPNIVSFVFSMGGKQIEYRRGAKAEPLSMEWPGTNPYISLNIIYQDGRNEEIVAESEWSLLEFLRKGGMRRQGGSAYKVTFSGLSFLLRADSSDNIISGVRELRRFKCPVTLVD